MEWQLKILSYNTNGGSDCIICMFLTTCEGLASRSHRVSQLIFSWPQKQITESSNSRELVFAFDQPSNQQAAMGVD